MITEAVRLIVDIVTVACCAGVIYGIYMRLRAERAHDLDTFLKLLRKGARRASCTVLTALAAGALLLVFMFGRLSLAAIQYGIEDVAVLHFYLATFSLTYFFYFVMSVFLLAFTLVIVEPLLVAVESRWCGLLGRAVLMFRESLRIIARGLSTPLGLAWIAFTIYSLLVPLLSSHIIFMYSACVLSAASVVTFAVMVARSFVRYTDELCDRFRRSLQVTA